MDLKKLREPFPPQDIEWRVQRSGEKDGKPWAVVLAYVTNRAIMDRLDDVCGPECWRNEFAAGPQGGVICGLSIYIDEEWITKWDGADNTDVESIKGGLSGAMKRAAVQWGIGRYLYHLDATFAVIDPAGAHRDTIKRKDGSRLPFKWNPPELPEWARPSIRQHKKRSIADILADIKQCPSVQQLRALYGEAKHACDGDQDLWLDVQTMLTDKSEELKKATA